ncbi:MAG: TetR family transcriptional regulator [Planctomycetes bacterium]|nr:TetR family transcriptional regulator [Planctomycetota bacterium]
MPPSRRDELIDAAMRVFYRHGFHATNIDRVLQEGGISRMTLYNHFKSKDDLIVAALHRRDELFRADLLKYVTSRADDPRARLLAVVDFLEQWLTGNEFRGCMFINAAAEYEDAASPQRGVALDHKRAIVSFLRDHCEAAGLAQPDELAEQINLLIEGATVTAQIDRGRATEVANLARSAIVRLVDGAA